MTIRTRLAVTSLLLVVAGVSAACGGGEGSDDGSDGARAVATKDEFCKAQSSFLTDLDLDTTDPTEALPPEKEMAKAVRTWGERIEEVGTPEAIPSEARSGFEELVKAAKNISEADLKSPDLDVFEGGMSAQAQKQVEAFTTYVSDTCGSMFGDRDLPEME